MSKIMFCILFYKIFISLSTNHIQFYIIITSSIFIFDSAGYYVFRRLLFLFFYHSLSEGNSHDQIKLTKWIWPKLGNMTKKLTTTYVNIWTWLKKTSKLFYWSCSKVIIIFLIQYFRLFFANPPLIAGRQPDGKSLCPKNP